MIALNQNQFVALSMEELVNNYGGYDRPAWVQKTLDFMTAVGEVLVGAASLYLLGKELYNGVK